MKLISNFKRAGYVVAALALLLAATPVNPIATWLVNGGGSSAYADSVTAVSTCDELQSALNDSDVATINLSDSFSCSSYVTISDGYGAKTINGNNNVITFSSTKGFIIANTESTIIKDLTVTGVTRGINVTNTTTNITLDNVIMSASERGVTYDLDNVTSSSLTVNNSIIKKSGISDYDTEYVNNQSYRGISLWEFQNSTANITNSTIEGFAYDINMACSSNCSYNSTINIDSTTLKGRDGLNIWSSNATINVTDSYLHGINNQNGPTEGFANVVLYSGTAGNKLTFTNTMFTNYMNSSVTVDSTASQYMYDDRGGNTAEFYACGFKDTTTGRHTRDFRNVGGTATVYSGTYDYPFEDDYLASGKVNYLVDGRYVVDTAPTSDLLPSRVMFNIADGGTYTFSGLASDTTAQTYGTTEAHYGSVSGTPTFDLTTGVLTAPVAGYGAANLTYDIYRNVSGTATAVTSYNEKVLFDAYSVSEIDDQYVQVGSTIDDLEIEAEMSKYSTSEFTSYTVSTEDSSIATIAENTDGKYTVTGVAAGTTKVIATITNVNSAVASQAVELGNIYVWDFDTTGNETRYDIAADGGTATLKASEAYDQDAVACYARQKSDTSWTNCSDFAGLAISSSDGTYTVTGAGIANSYRVKFVDTINGTTVAETGEIMIVAHKIALSGDDIEDGNVVYLTSGSSTDVTAKSKYVKWDIQTPTVTTTGNVTATVTDNGSGSYTIEAEGAGIVTVEFTDGVATETLMLYVVDFTVDAAEYHLTSDNQVTQLINAINEYWETTDHGDIAHNTGTVTTKIKLSKVSQGSSFADGDEYDFTLQDGVKPDRYTLTLYASVNGRVVDQKDVKIYVYEMVTPSTDMYYGEMADGATSYTFNNVKVSDRINRALSDEQPATITAEVTEGDATAVEIDNANGTVEISEPGYYEVTYTDTMGDGTVAGTWTAEFTVYEVETQTVFVAAGETVMLSSHSDYDATSARDGRKKLDVVDGEVEFEAKETELGEHTVKISHKFDDGKSRLVKQTSVIVYQVVADEETEPAGVTKQTIESLMDLYNEALASGDWTEVNERAEQIFGSDTEGAATYAGMLASMLRGQEIETNVVVTDISDSTDEDFLSEKKEIKKALLQYSVDQIDYYDVSVWVNADGVQIGEMHQLDEQITVKLTETEEPAVGYTRQHYVTRTHDGLTTVLTEGVDYYIEDGVIYVISDEFSTYAVAYKDTVIPSTPDTGSDAAGLATSSATISVAVAMALAAVTLAGAAVVAKRR